MKCIAKYKQGLAIESTSRDHTITMDMNQPLGENRGMTPGEVLINSLAGCKAMAFVSLGKVKNIDVKDLAVEITGEIEDVGIVEGTEIPIRNFKSIKTIYTLKTTNTKEEIEKHLKLVDEFCTINNALSDKITNTNEVSIVS